jgi:uncharacterized protein (DUF849 family)
VVDDFLEMLTLFGWNERVGFDRQSRVGKGSIAKMLQI